jgi:hypothetical protein
LGDYVLEVVPATFLFLLAGVVVATDLVCVVVLDFMSIAALVMVEDSVVCGFAAEQVMCNKRTRRNMSQYVRLGIFRL